MNSSKAQVIWLVVNIFNENQVTVTLIISENLKIARIHQHFIITNNNEMMTD